MRYCVHLWVCEYVYVFVCVRVCVLSVSQSTMVGNSSEVNRLPLF